MRLAVPGTNRSEYHLSIAASYAANLATQDHLRGIVSRTGRLRITEQAPGLRVTEISA